MLYYLIIPKGKGPIPNSSNGMKMETSTSCSAHCDDDQRDLESLLEAFGSAFSLEDITSAYFQASRNIDMAGDILYALHESTTTAACVFKDGLEVASATYSDLSSECEGASSTSSDLSSGNVLQKSNHKKRNFRVPKDKKCSTSLGTVSSVIGKDYVRPKPLTNESCKATKPLKLDSREVPVSEIWSEDVPLNTAARHDTVHKDVEEFLFQMLGDGFQLDRNVIRDVLGHCGYDAKKSMGKLLDLSISTLGNGDNVVDITTEKSAGKRPVVESHFCEENLEVAAQIDGIRLTENKEETAKRKKKDRQALSREVLESLFKVPERLEERPRIKPVKLVRRPFGKPVTGLFEDTLPGCRTATLLTKVDDSENDEQDNFEGLQTAVRENLIIMKEYYNTALETFMKGDHALAYKLLDKGESYKTKAREADDKAMEDLYKTRKEDLSLDLRDHKPIEALRLLRLHLNTFSGIQSIQYFKVTVGSKAEDKKGARKRRITEELDKESIKWTEEGDGMILIRVDEINPKRLSFANKQ